MNLRTDSVKDQSEPVIEASGLRRVYAAARGSAARTALDGVGLRVEPGEWVALLGPNGSGKSTLLRMLATLEPSDGGARLRMLGAALPGGEPRVRARLGVVFQKPGLDSLLTVRENLLMQGALFGMRRADAEARAREVAARLGVADRLGERVGRLSGGLARRVDLARALLCDPDLLLLDEPTTGLDLDARRQFLGALDEARAARAHMAIVMTTHLMDEAERADRVLMLSEGRVVVEGAPDALRRSVGARIVSTDGANAGTLEAAGLTTRRAEDGRGIVGAGEETSVAGVCDALLKAGAAFSVGPATLGDVYLARTGRSLEDAAPAEDAP